MKNALKIGLFATVVAISAAACTDPEDTNTATTPEGAEQRTAVVDTAKTPTPPAGEVREEAKGE
ncbi:MAG: hypothetical protein ACKOXB_04085 [Flavobacteriales bacterium]